MQSKYVFFILFFIFKFHVSAQLKVGNNPKVISTNAYFDVESNIGNHLVFSKDSGKVGIGTVLPSNKLHIKDTISKNPLRIEGLLSGSTTSDSVLMINSTGVVKRNSPSAVVSAYEPWYNEATLSGATSNTQNIYQMGNVGIGTNNPKSIFNIESTSGTIINTRFVTTNNIGANLVLQKSANATAGDNTAVPNGDVIGRIAWKSNNGSGYNANSGAEIRVDQVGLCSSTNNGTKIAFSTTKLNTIVPVERMTIVDSGFVGIGTLTPSTTLTVDNAGTTGAATGAQAFFRDNGAGNAIIALQTKGVRVGWYGLDRSTSTMYWNNDGTGTGNALSSAKMVLTSAGNFGLGTTAPGGALTLYGASSLALPSTIQGIANASKEIVFGRGGVTTGLAAITAVDNGTFGGGLSFLTKASNSMDNFPTSAIQSMVIDWNGRVGIGTGSPNWLLDVQTNSNSATQTAQFVNANGGTSAESHIGIGAGPGAWARLVGYNGTLGIRNYSTGLELMTIKTSGNIGLGTTSPAYPLHVKSSSGTNLFVENTASDPNGAIIVSVPGTNVNCGGALSCSEMISFQLGGSWIGSITPTTAGNGTQYLTTSDVRLKENIKSSKATIDDLMKLNVVDYNYKSDVNKTPETGFIAQELYKLVPSVVKVGADELDENGRPIKPWMVDYGKLTPLIIKAAQDLKKENEDQAKLIQKQTLMIDDLLNRIGKLESKIK